MRKITYKYDHNLAATKLVAILGRAISGETGLGTAVHLKQKLYIRTQESAETNF